MLGNDIKSTIDIPEFVNNNKIERVRKSKPELKYIKAPEGKDWRVIRELDELIGVLLANGGEPEKVKINYNILVNTNNRTERVKGIIVSK